MSLDTKRRLLYNQRVAPNTFVLFFHEGPGETTWSIRDYSIPGSVELRHASDFQDGAGRIPTALEIRVSADHDFPAPQHPTTDLDHWHALVRAKNEEHLAGVATAAPAPTVPIAQEPSSGGVPAHSFPILNLPKLMASPKARKRGDIERILHSKNSEDYVTWNFFQLIDLAPPSQWWPELLKMTGVTCIDPTDTPSVRLWQTTAVPRAYEALSRERMRASDNPSWRERSFDMKPVEGPSEIDITLEGRDYMIYVEAKLGSDVCLRSTYDPERNQIARNIDCALEVCGKRRPMFWMFVRDRQPGRAYIQLMDRYLTATHLSRSLPHRAASRIQEVSAALAVVTWSELLKLVTGMELTGTEAEARGELQRRASLT